MPPQLPDDVVEEILARFPPDEPAHLVRAALACKAWHRIVSGAGFRRRLHGRAPPLLGFFHHHGSHPAYFNPTSPFRPTYAARAGWLILNGRHGRFLHCGKPLQVRRQEQVPEVLAKLEVLPCHQDLGQGEFDSS
nr:unnamed protein product [Digitaria exilis]